jgi:hypothetical protein
MKKFYFLLSIAVITSILLLNCNSKKMSLKDIKKDASLVYPIVQKYYQNLEKKNYADALKDVDYINDNSRKTDISWLRQNNNKYSIEFTRRAGKIVGYEYSYKANQFRVITVVTIHNNIDKINRMLNESIYLKRINDKYEIVHITSNDIELKNRCDSNTGDFSTIYDGTEYHAIN